MSGNRMKLKNGLLGVVLLTSSLAFGTLQECYVDKLDLFTENVIRWADRTFNKKVNTKTYLAELTTEVLGPVEALEQEIPLIPTSAEKLKKMVGDLKQSLDVMHTTLSEATGFASLKAQLGSSSLLKEMLEKAQADLDDLIAHASKHPEECSPKVLTALKKYRNTTFKKCFDEWHPKENTFFLNALARIFLGKKK